MRTPAVPKISAARKSILVPQVQSLGQADQILLPLTSSTSWAAKREGSTKFKGTTPTAASRAS
jgi:hypothetical protein